MTLNRTPFSLKWGKTQKAKWGDKSEMTTDETRVHRHKNSGWWRRQRKKTVHQSATRGHCWAFGRRPVRATKLLHCSEVTDDPDKTKQQLVQFDHSFLITPNIFLSRTFCSWALDVALWVWESETRKSCLILCFGEVLLKCGRVKGSLVPVLFKFIFTLNIEKRLFKSLRTNFPFLFLENFTCWFSTETWFKTLKLQQLVDL